MEYNARVDAIARRDGQFWLIVTWSHLLFDGKGAELFCAELARLCDGIDLPEETGEKHRSPPATLVAGKVSPDETGDGLPDRSPGNGRSRHSAGQSRGRATPTTRS